MIAARVRKEAGFSYLEVLISATLLAVTLLTICGMFVAGYSNVDSAGNTTMGIAATRLLMEDLRRLPFASLASLDDFDSDDPTTLPASGPEREAARRWRYALAGDGPGWTFTADEKNRWPDFSIQGDALGAAGSLTITPVSATVARIDVRVSVPGRWRDIEVSTLIADL